ADGTVALSVGAGSFTDAAGNDNTASNEVTATFDGTAPTVNITGAPTTVNATTSFTVTIIFSEDVTGFESTDITTSNATVSSLAGSGAVYQAHLTAAGSGAITLVVPADAAVDAGNNGNLASNSVNIADVTVEQTQELIASFIQTRANQLIRSQPGLTGFLSGQAQGEFDVNVTRGQGQFNFASNPDDPIWMRAQGSWSSNTTSKSRYMFGALGSHRKVNENLLIGAMLQFDHLSEDTGNASVDGTGWMVGPYFVAKSARQPLYFEGRLLYGETSNTISPFGTYEDDFDTTRVLAQFKVTGEYAYGSTTTLYPFFDASYVADDQHSYVDSLGNTIPGQDINLGQIEIGLDFKRDIPVISGELTLLGGVSGIWSQTGGSGFASTVSPDYEGGRMRVELGVNRMLSATRTFNAATFYDGIGAGGFESFGVSLGYKMQF
uniref:Ig-like domain-containing protein n=1 Tax=Celeribacter baekdonensis TaxID=875171 RepID=UPI003A9145EC